MPLSSLPHGSRKRLICGQAGMQFARQPARGARETATQGGYRTVQPRTGRSVLYSTLDQLPNR